MAAGVIPYDVWHILDDAIESACGHNVPYGDYTKARRWLDDNYPDKPRKQNEVPHQHQPDTHHREAGQ